MRSRRHIPLTLLASSALPTLTRLWLLRTLSLIRSREGSAPTWCFRNDALTQALGLKEQSLDSSGDDDISAMNAQLRRLQRTAEAKAAEATLPEHVHRNVQRLAGLVGLSDTDCRILEFVVAIHSESLLEEVTASLGQLSSHQVHRTLSLLLDLPESAVRQSFGAQGILTQSGLVTMDRNGSNALRYKLDLISPTFADLMYNTDAEPLALLRGMVDPVPPGHLQLSDYAHVQNALDALLPYLQHAQQTRRVGVNIFVHGAPGTGKSQLARTLAQVLGCELFNVTGEDSDGDPISGERRLRAFRAAQTFFTKSQPLVVFDEAEDIFNDGTLTQRSTAYLRKAWMNRMLEDNPVPTVWLSNSVQGLDPAFIRRFDIIFELPIPPQAQRERILQQSCGDLVDAPTLSRLASTEALTPAVAAKASAVVHAIHDELGPQKSADVLEMLISNTLQAQGHAPLAKHDPTRLPAVYDPAFIHTDADLGQLVEGIRNAGTARLCMYGPPGTGKTAYGRWLAQQLGLPLQIKRASDLISPYVGQSEKNMALAFQRAQSEGALLLIDEVDSFLQDRRQAKHSWEVSLVNEMLTQMEAFAGVFIASTNLMDHLDPAALRRFDLKLKFDYLKPQQSLGLLQRHCASLALPPPDANALALLAQQPQLTPGDFATVIRQHRFRPYTHTTHLVQALVTECALKHGGLSPRAIGFTALH